MGPTKSPSEAHCLKRSYHETPTKVPVRLRRGRRLVDEGQSDPPMITTPVAAVAKRPAEIRTRTRRECCKLRGIK
jgi:hypothetical protein